MEPMKNLCGLIPESLHKRLMEGKDPEMTNGEYLTKVLTAYLDQPTIAKQEQRTLAVQISEDMFQQLKSYLDAHSPLTQKALVQSLLNQALDQWEQGEEPLQDATLQDNKKERTLAIATPEIPDAERWSDLDRLNKERELVGIYPDEVQDQEFDPEQDEQGFGMSMTM